MTSDIVVSARGIDKFFGGVRALADVSVDIRAGEVLALVGDNGAGKSTFTRVISGLDHADAGELYFGSELVHRPNARRAQRFGIEVVPQHLALCDNLSAAMNVVLGDPPVRWSVGALGWIDRRAAREIARKSVAEVGARLTDLDAPIRRMSGGQRQAIAIGRALHRGGRMVIFDEPTAALGVRQRETTLKLIRQVADRGLAAVVISHSVEDMFAVADRVIAFRLGRVVLDSRIGETDRETVRRAMEGLDSVTR